MTHQFLIEFDIRALSLAPAFNSFFVIIKPSLVTIKNNTFLSLKMYADFLAFKVHVSLAISNKWVR